MSCFGRRRHRDVPIIKEGVLYEDYKRKIKPLDLVLFKGGDFISDAIRYLQKKTAEDRSVYKIDPDAFSHVGIVVTSEIIDDPLVKEGKLYLWESTMSGNLSDGVPDVNGESFLGVQLRDLDEVIKAYDRPNDTRIAFASLKKENLEKVWSEDSAELLKTRMTEIFTWYNGTKYDANLYSLTSTVIPCLRRARGTVETIVGSEDWLFCSELVATIYRDLDLISGLVEPKNVTPMDFIGFDLDGIENSGMPVIVDHPVYVVSALHSD